MKPKHLVNIILALVCLAGTLTAPPAPASAQAAFDCAAVSEIPQAECQALVALYNAAGGPNWSTNDGWLQTVTPCSWFGVTCDAGHVSRLSLGSKGLQGPIPPEFGNLSNLVYLELYWNDLTSLPPEFGNLINLTELYLGGTLLTTLPSEFGNLSNLTKLFLGGREGWRSGNITPLISLPPEFGNLSKLSSLHINFTALTTLPPEFGNLSNLSSLDLSENSLTSLPHEFGNLSNLITLNLSRNSLRSLPSEFGNLTNLTDLYLFLNHLTALPPEFGNLSNLSYLNLGYNNLGTLPPNFYNLANLNELSLSNTGLTSLPPEFVNLSNLSMLDLDYNSLTSLPPEFGDLINLTELYLQNNPLRGSIPEFMTKLTSLSTFKISKTEWCTPTSGPVPVWLANIGSSGSGLVCDQPPTTLTFSPVPELYTHIGATFTVTVMPVNIVYPVTFTWNIDDLPAFTHVCETPNDSVWITWDTPRNHTLSVTASNELGSIATSQTVFVHPVVSTVIPPNIPERLTYIDTQGSPTILDLPAGSVTQTAALLFWPKSDPALTPAWRPAGHSFKLELYRDGIFVPDPTFPNPLTLILHYTDTDLANVDRPAGLQLMRRDGNSWQPAACGPVSRNLEQRVLSMPLCQLGEFALFGPATLTEFVEPTTTIQNGDILTYTLVFSDPEGGTLRLFDPISPTLEWLGFVAAPSEGAAFSNVTFSDGAISGTLSLSPTHPLTLAFTVHAALPKSTFVNHHAALSNTAFFCLADANPCILHPSNTVSSDVLFRTHIFLPLLLRAP